MDNNDPSTEVPEEEQKFDMSPEEATNLDGGLKPGLFNRKKVLIFICVFLAVTVCGGLIFSTLKPSKKKSSSVNEPSASGGSSSSFVSSLRDRAVNNRDDREIQPTREPEPEAEPEPLLPPVSFNREIEPPPPRPPQNQGPPPPPAQAPQQQTHYVSSLVPAVQGSLFSSGVPQFASASQQPQSADYSRNPYAAYGNQSQAAEYALQNNQQDKQSFYDSSNGGGAVYGGRFLGENAIWTGTIIPGILITAINTDLPGNILARVTQNVFDSGTGRRLLIPQGTVLIARYNSSVSYAQNRVQIVWDTIIRPDGFQIDLEGANGVDRSGMSGQAAVYHENWFEYLKAAGIITLFTIANSKLAETAAQYSSGDTAADIAASGAEVVNQLGGNIVSRALNIQPTLTVDNGTPVNIMLNKTLYLPPVASYHVTQRYILE